MHGERLIQIGERAQAKGSGGKGMSITRTQHKCLMAIREFMAHKGYSPRYREIAEALGLRSIDTVRRVIHILEEQGFLKIQGFGTGMNLELTPQKNLEMNSCKLRHPRIWFQENECPLCSLLQTISVEAPPPGVGQ
jgi:SOS-response transcriptional repressor LexA